MPQVTTMPEAIYSPKGYLHRYIYMLYRFRYAWVYITEYFFDLIKDVLYVGTVLFS